MNVIKVRDISKEFKIPHEKRDTFVESVIGFLKGEQMRYEEFWALRDINFTVRKGECLGVIGENGSGKSTLLKILANVLVPDKGRVAIKGTVAPFLELGVGFHPDLTAKENVYLYGYMMGMRKREMEAIIDDIFEFAELERFDDMRLKNYSAGMHMRLAFSTAITTDPDIFLIDEVLEVGDDAFKKKCVKKFKEFKREGKTIVYVSHALRTVKNICERSILLSEGKIISEGESGTVIDDYYKLLERKK